MKEGLWQIYESFKFTFRLFFVVIFENTYFALLVIAFVKASMPENTSLFLVTALQGLSCPDKSPSCSAAALS